MAVAAGPALGSHPIRRLWARWLWLLPLLVLASAALVVALAYGLAWGEWLPLVAAHALAGLVALVAPPVAALLWWALWRLRCAMLEVQDQAEASSAAAQAQLQRRAQVAALSVRLQQAQSPVELADTLLSQLAQLLPVRQALCALWNDTERTLVAAARYGGAGADAQAVMTRLPRLGTLLHECALQRQPLRIPDPGAGFPRVSSGLGDMAPAEIVLYPVQYGGQVFAVLELAAVRPLAPEDLQLLADIEPVFAMGLDIVQRADRTERLLDEARAASEHSQLMLAQAQEAAQHQHQLLAHIGHEVRSAMNAVVDGSHVLLHSPLQPAQQRTVHHVLAAGRHVLALLNEQLDGSSAHRDPPQPPLVAPTANALPRTTEGAAPCS